MQDFKCLCIRKGRFITDSSMKSCVQVSNVQCDTVCPGHKSDMCGGKKKNDNTNLAYFSAYEIIQSMYTVFCKIVYFLVLHVTNANLAINLDI